MTDSSQDIHNKLDPNMTHEPENVEPLRDVKQEANEWNNHGGGYQAPIVFPDFSILGRIYEELLHSKQQNRFLEQRMSSIEDIIKEKVSGEKGLIEQKISDIESTLKERASKEKSVLDLAQEAVDCACHTLGESMQTVTSQKEAMEQLKKNNDDKFEKFVSRLKKIGGNVETIAKNSETDKGMCSTTLKEMKRQLNYITEFLSNNSTGNMQQISEMFKTSNIETNKTITDHLEKFSESNNNGFRKVRHQLYHVEDVIAKSKPAAKAENESKVFEEQLNMIQSKLEVIDKKSDNTSTKLDNLPIHQNTSLQNELQKIHVFLTNSLGYLKTCATDNTNNSLKRFNTMRSILGQINSQVNTIKATQNIQKSPDTVLEKIQDQLTDINELLNEKDRNRKDESGDSYDDDSDEEEETEAVAEKKEACFFCQYTDHKSEDCHVFPTSNLRKTKLIESRICPKCLKSDDVCNWPHSCPAVVCQYCIAQYPAYPNLYIHHQIMCSYKKKEEKSDPVVKKEVKPDNRYKPY